MSDYQRVEEALAQGAEPQLLCATCPWDRYCITPPTMTKADYEKQMEEAKAKDMQDVEKAKAEGKEVGLPVGTLLTALTMGGRVNSGQLCPVFALRLRSSQGRDVVDRIKTEMTSFDDRRV